MRALSIALGGLVVAAGLAALGLHASGLLGAALVMVSLCMATMSLGISLATSRTVGRLTAPPIPRRIRNRLMSSRRLGRCTTCGGTRERHGQIWLCVACDVGPRSRSEYGYT